VARTGDIKPVTGMVPSLAGVPTKTRRRRVHNLRPWRATPDGTTRERPVLFASVPARPLPWTTSLSSMGLCARRSASIKICA